MIFTLSGVTNATPMNWNDHWTGHDKNMHFIAGAAISSAVTIYSENSNYGMIAGCSLGLLKEVSDMHRSRATSSFQDAAVTCLGSVLGAKLVEGLYLTPNKIEFTVRF